jgi:hypothetical protein
MKRVLIATVVLICGAAGSANAQDVDGRTGLSEEQAKQRQSVVEKYDTDGDGLLSKDEEKGLSEADKKTLAKTGGVGTARKAPLRDADKPGQKQQRDRDRERNHGRMDQDSVKGDSATKASRGGGGKGKGGKK